MPVLDVRPGVDGERPRLAAVVVPEGGAPEHVVGAVEREPGVGGGEAGGVVGEAGDPGEEGAVAAGGAEGAVREHDPWGLLVAHVAARGGAPRAAGGADAGAVAGMREARDDSAQEIRREVGPRHRRSF